MTCDCDLCRLHPQRSTSERERGHDVASGRHRKRTNRKIGRGKPGGGEEIVLGVTAYPNVDFYMDPKSDPALAGALVQLYAVSEEVRTVEGSFTITDNTKPLRVSAVGRGCTRWEVSITLLAAVPATTAIEIPMSIVSFSDGSATAASTAPSGGGVPAQGAANWSAQNGSAGTIKAVAGNLWQLFGTNTSNNQRWFLIFDKAAAAINGDTRVISVLVPAGGTFTVTLTDPQDPNPPGRAFANGIQWAVSSTAPALTAAADVFEVISKFT